MQCDIFKIIKMQNDGKKDWYSIESIDKVSNIQLHLESKNFSSFKPVSCIQESIRIGGEVSKSTNKAVKG